MTKAIVATCFATLLFLLITLQPSRASGYNPLASTMTINVAGAPVRQVLEILFIASHKRYAIAANVGGFVTIHLYKSPFKTSLRTILKSSDPPLVCHVRRGRYWVTENG